jgi:hypothetical protein
LWITAFIANQKIKDLFFPERKEIKELFLDDEEHINDLFAAGGLVRKRAGRFESLNDWTPDRLLEADAR